MPSALFNTHTCIHSYICMHICLCFQTKFINNICTSNTYLIIEEISMHIFWLPCVHVCVCVCRSHIPHQLPADYVNFHRKWKLQWSPHSPIVTVLYILVCLNKRCPTKSETSSKTSQNCGNCKSIYSIWVSKEMLAHCYT